MTQTSSDTRPILDAREKVREIFLCFAKLISAKTIYTANNPTLANFTKSFYDAFLAFFESEKELQLRVDQYRLLWRDEVVYESEDRGGSIAFMLFKDGIGELTFHSSVTVAELDQFVDIIKEEIHNPSPQSDVVTRLWNSDFANISYRVLDEDPVPQEDGQRGGGARLSASVLQADDHPSLDDSTPSRVRLADNEVSASIAAYLLGVVNASRPETSEVEKEAFVQDMLGTLFSSSGGEKRHFLEEFAEDARSDKIAHLLETALDFTDADTSAMLENALGLAERAANYAKGEADARTLARTLTLVRERAGRHPNDGVRATLKRLEKELVDAALLRSLGVREDLPVEKVLGVLRYFRLAGPVSIPVIEEMLHANSKHVVHREACDTLIAVAGNRIGTVIESLDIDNVYVARDVVYLLRATSPNSVTPVLKELVHYPDTKVREATLHLLADSANADAVPLLCTMLDDEDKSIRLSALAVLEGRSAAVAGARVLSLCFDADAPPRDMDERLRLFEAAGRLAGAEVVDRFEQVLNKRAKRAWFRFGSQATRDDKLLAVAALGVAGGQRARAILEKLAGDRDEDVKVAARKALDAGGPDAKGGDK